MYCYVILSKATTPSTSFVCCWVKNDCDSVGGRSAGNSHLSISESFLAKLFHHQVLLPLRLTIIHTISCHAAQEAWSLKRIFYAGLFVRKIRFLSSQRGGHYNLHANASKVILHVSSSKGLFDGLFLTQISTSLPPPLPKLIYFVFTSETWVHMNTVR